ncbi:MULTISPECIES: hypothetical protein [unclassified Streptomyces]|uniref:hypothetical protein n=1 Tax=unclassified Streptomyces TaxID=2593676 RepID=UPI0034020184
MSSTVVMTGASFFESGGRLAGHGRTHASAPYVQRAAAEQQRQTRRGRLRRSPRKGPT